MYTKNDIWKSSHTADCDGVEERVSLFIVHSHTAQLFKTMSMYSFTWKLRILISIISTEHANLLAYEEYEESSMTSIIKQL